MYEGQLHFEINLATEFQDINVMEVECPLDHLEIACLRTLQHRIIILN